MGGIMSKKEKKSSKKNNGKVQVEKAQVKEKPVEMKVEPPATPAPPASAGVSVLQNVPQVPPEEQIPITKKNYEKELAKLQIELVKLQEWIKFKGMKLVIIFEGRDAAGKGGAIKRI